MRVITIHAPLSAIGDSLLMVPAMRAIRHDYPEARLRFAGNPWGGAWLRRAGVIDEALPPDADLVGTDVLIGLSWTPQAWRKEHFRSGARVVVGAPFLNPAGVHMARHLYEQVKRALPIWAPYDPSPLPYPISAPIRDRYAGTIVLAPYASWLVKEWPHFDELAGQLRSHRVVILEEDGDWLDAAEILAAAALVIGCDSAPCHAAALSGTPTIVLFGPTIPAHWHPIGGPTTLLRGCPSLIARTDTNTVIACERGDCWDRLPVEDVLDAVRVMLARIEA